VTFPDSECLGALYGLTPAQAKMACEFAKGGSYKEVASRMSISEDTVRSHVKEIYPKLRVNRSADLVRLILLLSHSGV
jgi:DNA-binding CsgD family transcriptional regulator